jgi:hypothetical protein
MAALYGFDTLKRDVEAEISGRLSHLDERLLVSNNDTLKVLDLRCLIHRFRDLIERIYHGLNLGMVEPAASYKVQESRVRLPGIHELAQDLPVIEHHIEVGSRQWH